MIRFSFVCLLVTIALVFGQEPINLVNTNVERSLDLVSHIPKETISVTVENRGTKGVRHYDYWVEPQHIEDVAYVGAVVSIIISVDLIYKRKKFSRSKAKIEMTKSILKRNKRPMIRRST